VIRSYGPQDFSQLVDIFWETSARQNFSSDQEKAAFRHQYLDAYLNDVVLVATEGERVLGYILCQLDTLAHQSEWSPHLALFADLYEQYPAHLHINFRSESRGGGLGSALVVALEKMLAQRNIKGLHLITAAHARNVSFYNKNGFSHQVAREWKSSALLFMGKTL
jgi:ribosomal protein S18 acetylase RimI-like enzyme